MNNNILETVVMGLGTVTLALCSTITIIWIFTLICPGGNGI